MAEAGPLDDELLVLLGEVLAPGVHSPSDSGLMALRDAVRRRQADLERVAAARPGRVHLRAGWGAILAAVPAAALALVVALLVVGSRGPSTGEVTDLQAATAALRHALAARSTSLGTIAHDVRALSDRLVAAPPSRRSTAGRAARGELTAGCRHLVAGGAGRQGSTVPLPPPCRRLPPPAGPPPGGRRGGSPPPGSGGRTPPATAPTGSGSGSRPGAPGGGGQSGGGSVGSGSAGGRGAPPGTGGGRGGGRSGAPPGGGSGGSGAGP